MNKSGKHSSDNSRVSSNEFQILTNRNLKSNKKISIRSSIIKSINLFLLGIIIVAIIYFSGFYNIFNLFEEENASIKYAVVKHDNTILRESNGIEFPTILILNKNEKLIFIKKENNWIKLKNQKGITGWVEKSKVSY